MKSRKNLLAKSVVFFEEDESRFSMGRKGFISQKD